MIISNSMNNYSNQYLKNNTINSENQFQVLSNKEIEEEEDRLDEEAMRKVGVDFKDHDYQWYKKNTITFPPYNAPGIVRRAWREAEEKATPAQKLEMKYCFMLHQSFLEEQPKYQETMSNDLGGYMKFVKDLNTYVEEYNNPECKEQYNSWKSILTSFESELKKYI